MPRFCSFYSTEVKDTANIIFNSELGAIMSKVCTLYRQVYILYSEEFVYTGHRALTFTDCHMCIFRYGKSHGIK